MKNTASRKKTKTILDLRPPPNASISSSSSSSLNNKKVSKRKRAALSKGPRSSSSSRSNYPQLEVESVDVNTSLRARRKEDPPVKMSPLKELEEDEIEYTQSQPAAFSEPVTHHQASVMSIDFEDAIGDELAEDRRGEEDEVEEEEEEEEVEEEEEGEEEENLRRNRTSPARKSKKKKKKKEKEKREKRSSKKKKSKSSSSSSPSSSPKSSKKTSRKSRKESRRMREEEEEEREREEVDVPRSFSMIELLHYGKERLVNDVNVLESMYQLEDLEVKEFMEKHASDYYNVFHSLVQSLGEVPE